MPRKVKQFVKKETYRERMKDKITLWAEIHAIGAGLVRYAHSMKLTSVYDEAASLLQGLEHAGITMQELADVEIMPMILASWQPRLPEERSEITEYVDEIIEEENRANLAYDEPDYPF